MVVYVSCRVGHPRVASLALTGNSPSEGTPPYSIILYYGMLVKPLDKMYPVGCDDLGAPYLTIDTRYPVGEHIVLPRNVKSNGSWTFLAQTPVALRAHTVRPYD